MKNFRDLQKELKSKQFQPLYFLHGEEPYFIDAITGLVEEESLPPEERDFGLTVLYGQETNVGDVLAMARQIPMFGERAVILVKEAQHLKIGDTEAQLLENYAENPMPSNILLFAHKYGKLDTRRKFVKSLAAKGYLFYSEPIKDYNLASWIGERLKDKHLKAEAKIAVLLAEYLGNDLNRIDNELDKLVMILGKNSILDAASVEKHIGISKDYNVFELQKALREKNAALALKIAHYIGQNPKNNPLPLILGNLNNFFMNLILVHTLKGIDSGDLAKKMEISPYFVKDFQLAAAKYPLKMITRIISILRETDLKSKGLGANQVSEAELLIETVYKIVHIEQIKVAI